MQPNARRWIYIALAYFCVAVSIGCWMGATQQFAFAPLHAHINLLGWVTMTLTGLIYHHFPAAANNRLAQIHFWGYNALVPVMMMSLGLLLAGHTEVEPLLGMTSVATLSLIVLFAINVWRNGAIATATDGLSARPAATGADVPQA